MEQRGDLQRWSEAVRTFESGELGETLQGRVDTDLYSSGASELTNFLISDDGSLTRRSGTRFAAEVKSSSQAVRLVPFVYATAQAYVLEFGDLYLRFYRNNLQIEATDSGGTPLGSPYEIATPYSQEEVFGLRFTQSADVLFIVHEKHPPQKLMRRDYEALANTDGTTWSVDQMFIKDGPYLSAQKGGAKLGRIGGSGAAPGFYNLSVMEVDWNRSTVPHIVEGETMLWVATARGNDFSGLPPPDGSASQFPKGDSTLWRGILATGSAIGLDPTPFYFIWSNNFQWLNPIPGKASPQIGAALKAEGFLPHDIGRSFRFAGSINSHSFPPNTWFNSSHEWFWGIITDVAEHSSDPYQRKYAWVDIQGPMTVDNRNLNIVGTTNFSTTTQDIAGYHTWEGFRMGAWYIDNYPKVVTIHEQRLVMCGEPKSSSLLHASASAQFDQFAPTGDVSASNFNYPTSAVYMEVGDPDFTLEPLYDLVLDDNGFSFDILGDQVDIIRWAVGSQNSLILGTASGITVVRGGSSREALTPRNVFVQETALPGSAEVDAVGADNSVYYVSRNRRALHRVNFSIDSDAYGSRDTTEHARHILDTGVVELDYAEESDRLLMAVTGEGRLATMSISPEGRL